MTEREQRMKREEAIDVLAKQPGLFEVARWKGFKITNNLAFALVSMYTGEGAGPYAKRPYAHLEADLRQYAVAEVIVALASIDTENGRLNELLALEELEAKMNAYTEELAYAERDGQLVAAEVVVPNEAEDDVVHMTEEEEAAAAEVAATGTVGDEDDNGEAFFPPAAAGTEPNAAETIAPIVSSKGRRENADQQILPPREIVMPPAEGATFSKEGIVLSQMAIVEDPQRRKVSVAYMLKTEDGYVDAERMRVKIQFQYQKRDGYRLDNSSEVHILRQDEETGLYAESVELYFPQRPFDVVLTFQGDEKQPVQFTISSKDLPVHVVEKPVAA